MYEAEHNQLLKNLEKNLEIPEDCTYADKKAIDTEVSTQKGAVLQEKSLFHAVNIGNTAGNCYHKGGP